MDMNISKMKQFIKICEYNNISKAADSIFISQSALSQALSSFEKALGVKLFERNNNVIKLNESGQIALKYCKEITSKYDEMLSGVVNAKNHFSNLRFASEDNALFNLVSAYYLRDHPSTQLSKVDIKKRSPIKLMQTDQLDACFFSFDYAKDHRGDIDLISIPLFTEYSYVYVPKDSPFYGKKEARLKEFEGLPFCINSQVLTPEKCDFSIGYVTKDYIEKNKIYLNTTYYDLQAVSLLFESPHFYFLVCTLGQLLSPSGSSRLDKKRLVRITDPELTRTFYYVSLYKNQRANSLFFDWFFAPGNELRREISKVN